MAPRHQRRNPLALPWHISTPAPESPELRSSSHLARIIYREMWKLEDWSQGISKPIPAILCLVDSASEQSLKQMV
jgi:hypothetical protein